MIIDFLWKPQNFTGIHYAILSMNNWVKNSFFPCILRDLDKIDDMMQDITEQQDIAQEITEALTRRVGDDFDEVCFDIKNKKWPWL